MITFLASPKGFTGVARDSQLTAIRSWLSVAPGAEVILYGESDGTAAAAASLGVGHVPAVDSSPSGIPFFNAIVAHARQHASFDLQVYLNCDIVVTHRMVDALHAIAEERFLLVGQRIDLSEAGTRTLHSRRFDDPLDAVREDDSAALHGVSGIDYFGFRRGMWEGLPPLVIGRAGYDSALVAFCLRRGIPVVDATFVNPVVHQFHDYGHVRGAEREVFWGQDASNNRRLHDVAHSAANIGDATHRIVAGRVVPNRARGDRLRLVEVTMRYQYGLRLASYAVRALWRVTTAIGVHRPWQPGLPDVLPASHAASGG